MHLDDSEEIINISSLKKTGVKELLDNMFNDSSEESPRFYKWGFYTVTKRKPQWEYKSSSEDR